MPVFRLVRIQFCCQFGGGEGFFEAPLRHELTGSLITGGGCLSEVGHGLGLLAVFQMRMDPEANDQQGNDAIDTEIYVS